MPINQYQNNNDPININNSRLSYNLSNQTPLESFVQSIYVQNVNSLDKNNSYATNNQPNHLNISMLSKNNNQHINHLNNIKEDVSEERRQQLKAHLEKVERLQRMGKDNNNNNSVSINNRNINYL